MKESAELINIADGSVLEETKGTEREGEYMCFFVCLSVCLSICLFSLVAGGKVLVNISSLCLVAYDNKYEPPSATPSTPTTTSSSSFSSSPALLCGYTMYRQDRLVPLLAIFCLSRKSPAAKTKGDTTKASKSLDPAVFPDVLYEPLIDSTSLSELDLISSSDSVPLSVDLSSMLGMQVPAPPPSPSALSPPKDILHGDRKASPVLQATSDLQLLLCLEACSFIKVTPTHQVVPKIEQLLPMPGNTVVLNLTWTCGEGEGESGCLILLKVAEKGGATVIDKAPLATRKLDTEDDIICHMCTLPPFHLNDSSHLLAGVTKAGSVRIFSLPDLVVVTEYKSMSEYDRYVHCVPGPGLGTVVMTTMQGQVHVLTMEQQSDSLEQKREEKEQTGADGVCVCSCVYVHVQEVTFLLPPPPLSLSLSLSNALKIL